MKVLVCDQDASSRLAIKRIVVQHLPCTVLEAEDGVQALRALDEHDVALLILDVDLPVVDGVEVLGAVRTSDATRATPTIVMSRERRDEVVATLLRLGISGYLLKPIRTEKLLGALDGLRERLTRRRPRRIGRDHAPGLGPDSPALLVDGKLDYRRFFVSQTRKHGPVDAVGSGAAALASFCQTPVPLVFVGEDLGLLSTDMLVPKLRALSGTPIRVIGIVDTLRPSDEHSALFDDVLPRTYVPTKFKSEFTRFIGMPAAVAAVSELGGDLTQQLSSAARQVFGMMLDTELMEAPASTAGPFAGAVVDMTIRQRYLMTLKVFCPVDDLKAMASRMLQMPVEELTEDDYLSTATELANLVTGVLKAGFEERGVAMDCSLPKIDTTRGRWLEPGIETRGVVEHFRLVAAAADVGLALEIQDPAVAEAA